MSIMMMMMMMIREVSLGRLEIWNKPQMFKKTVTRLCKKVYIACIHYIVIHTARRAYKGGVH